MTEVDLVEPMLARPTYEQRQHIAELLRAVMETTLMKLALALDFLDAARHDLAELNRRLEVLRAISRDLALELERRQLRRRDDSVVPARRAEPQRASPRC